MDMEILEYNVPTTNLYFAHKLLVDIFDLEIEATFDGGFSFRYKDQLVKVLDHPQRVSRKATFPLIKLQSTRAEVDEIKRKLDFMTYSEPQLKKLFEVSYEDIILKKEVVLTITDPDNRQWRLIGKY